MVSASTIAGTVFSTLVETAALITASALTLSWIVPVLVGVTATVNTPGEISVIVPMEMLAVPALPKSAEVTVAASMSSLKVRV